jgi:hypothetical protein
MPLGDNDSHQYKRRGISDLAGAINDLADCHAAGHRVQAATVAAICNTLPASDADSRQVDTLWSMESGAESAKQSCRQVDKLGGGFRRL